VIAFSLLLLLHIVLLQIAVGPIADSCFANFWLEPIAKPIFGYPQNEVEAGTFKPSSPIHEASAKASAHFLIAKPILATCRDFCLPGVILNDLVRLRAAIIASCICGATKELRQSPLRLTFLVRLPGLEASRLLVTLGCELSHAAFRVGAGTFSLAGIHLEEILGVGFQVLQVDAVILRFCLLIVRISGFRRLAQIVRVCSIVDNAAASGVSGPGNDSPGRSSAFNARTVSDFNCLRFGRLFWRRGRSSQSRC
jgi:hypothetical protein